MALGIMRRFRSHAVTELLDHRAVRNTRVSGGSRKLQISHQQPPLSLAHLYLRSKREMLFPVSTSPLRVQSHSAWQEQEHSHNEAANVRRASRSNFTNERIRKARLSGGPEVAVTTERLNDAPATGTVRPNLRSAPASGIALPASPYSIKITCGLPQPTSSERGFW